MYTVTATAHSGATGSTPVGGSSRSARSARAVRVRLTVGHRSLVPVVQVRILHPQRGAGGARPDVHPPCKRKAAGSSPATGSSASSASSANAVRTLALSHGRRTGVQRCLASSACSVRYRGCPRCPGQLDGASSGLLSRHVWVRFPPRGQPWRGGRSGESRLPFKQDTLRVRGPSALLGQCPCSSTGGAPMTIHCGQSPARGTRAAGKGPGPVQLARSVGLSHRPRLVSL